MSEKFLYHREKHVIMNSLSGRLWGRESLGPACQKDRQKEGRGHMGIAFGPAGNADSFAAAGYKSSSDAPAFLSALGLNAYEYQCGNGVAVKEKGARSIGENARRHGVRLSIHAPYYISMSGEAGRVVYHPGGLGKSGREEALARSLDTLRYVIREMDRAGYGDIALCPEVMGKINQVGTVDEILEMCRIDERLIPCVDFGHLNARTHGSLCSQEAYEKVFDRMENALGRERTAGFHAHFSKIQYGKGGEIRHLTFEDNEYGPEFSHLAEVLVKRDYRPTVICESAGTQAEDAVSMMKTYEGIKKRF